MSMPDAGGLESERGEFPALALPSGESEVPQEWVAALSYAGPLLGRDVASSGCACSCHPRAASLGLHDAGRTCQCQWSEQEREDRRRAMLDSLAAFRAEFTEVDRVRGVEASAMADDLDVELWTCGGMAPFVVTGVVDGRAFYLRERHEAYQVAVAPDSDPLLDVWRSRDVSGVEIFAGPVEDLLVDGTYSFARAVEVAATCVRLYLRRLSCGHESAPEGSWFCPACAAVLDVSRVRRVGWFS